MWSQANGGIHFWKEKIGRLSVSAGTERGEGRGRNGKTTRESEIGGGDGKNGMRWSVSVSAQRGDLEKGETNHGGRSRAGVGGRKGAHQVADLNLELLIDESQTIAVSAEIDDHQCARCAGMATVAGPMLEVRCRTAGAHTPGPLLREATVGTAGHPRTKARASRPSRTRNVL